MFVKTLVAEHKKDLSTKMPCNENLDFAIGLSGLFLKSIGGYFSFRS